MASVLTNVVQAAHSATALSATALIEAVSQSPRSPSKKKILNIPFRSRSLERISFLMPLGRSRYRAAPRSYSTSDYNEFEVKGIRGTHVIAANDVLAVKSLSTYGHVLAHILSRPIRRAWKEKLAPQSTVVRFIVDDKGEFTSSVGLLLDTSGLLST
ncbi:hypothetical protein EV424DRAFT_1534227 [Suillus variegatus]|nr:hypothetical protein EV424DRAFT_1534227 [Suillus variegatus]